MTFDAAGDMTGISLADGAQITIGYDTAGNLSGYTDALGETGAILNRFDGQIEEEEIHTSGPPLVASYTYDRSGRLTRVDLPGGAMAHLHHNAAANRRCG
jgi:YD repeat-containing protein